MKCANHPEVESSAFCGRCGRAICNECSRSIQGGAYCEPCLAESIKGKSPTGNPGVTQTIGGSNPGAAFVLGLIPGVGAIYNGEFLKAALHVLIFGTLISLADIANRLEGIFILSSIVFFIYMPFEAYFTARKAKLNLQGIHLETPFDRLQEQIGASSDKELWAGGALIGVGVLFLLDNFSIFAFDAIERLWPLLLVGIGVWILRRRLAREG